MLLQKFSKSRDLKAPAVIKVKLPFIFVRLKITHLRGRMCVLYHFFFDIFKKNWQNYLGIISFANWEPFERWEFWNRIYPDFLWSSPLLSPSLSLSSLASSLYRCYRFSLRSFVFFFWLFIFVHTWRNKRYYFSINSKSLFVLPHYMNVWYATKYHVYLQNICNACLYLTAY